MRQVLAVVLVAMAGCGEAAAPSAPKPAGASPAVPIAKPKTSVEQKKGGIPPDVRQQPAKAEKKRPQEGEQVEESWVPLKAWVGTATAAADGKKRPDESFPVEKVWNRGIAGVKAEINRPKGLVRLTFDYAGELFIETQEGYYDKFGIGPQPFLARFFDANGNYLHHVETFERFYPLSSSEGWISEWERRAEQKSGRNPETYPPAEFVYLEEHGNKLTFRLNAVQASFVQGCEFGWMVKPLYGTWGKPFLIRRAPGKWQFSN